MLFGTVYFGVKDSQFEKMWRDLKSPFSAVYVQTTKLLFASYVCQRVMSQEKFKMSN